MTKMFSISAAPLAAIAGIGMLLLAGCDPTRLESAEAASNIDNSAPVEELTVFKSPSCGCCQGWIEHLNPDDFQVSVKHPVSLGPVKVQYNLVPEIQSCHTAVTAEGYVFEGHVPQKFMKRFLAEKPQGAIGLAVAGMPIGTPGMEAGARFTPYQVLLVQEDGSISTYASVSRFEDQYE